MLVSLHIHNYAIIDALEINFSNGFNIITGETGAGKSIILGALSLILGERADTSSLKQSDKKCFVEGLFTIANSKTIHKLLESFEIENDNNELIIRREIAANGKSRAFVNDTPVNLSQLKQLSSLLVDLHQQFDTLELGDADFQREVVDAIANNKDAVTQFTNDYKQYYALQRELQLLKEALQKATATLDYNQYLFAELEEANLQPNELENLEDEIKLLQNAETIKANLLGVTQALQNGEENIIQQIKGIANNLKSVASFNKNIEAALERLQSASLELADVSDELEQLNDKVHIDAERIEVVNDKINIGYKLLKKHNVQTTNELLEIKENLETAIQNATNSDAVVRQKEKAVQLAYTSLLETATILHEKRIKAAQPLVPKINTLLQQVGMPNAQVKINIEKGELNSYGVSVIDFLFDANKSNKFESIRKVASGGELSRLMLCIKSVVAEKIHLPVLIFDEIDTGISGEAAKQVGNIMANLSAQHQIICITHQAQIAAMAHTHYYVHKLIEKDTIVTSIKTLTKDERIIAIAQMLSGEKPTAAALENAKDMVGN